MLYINNKAVGITVVDKVEVQVPVEVPVEVIKYEDTPEEAQHKQDIKNAIINKGQSVSDDISEWASAINNISGGEGSGSGDSSEKIKEFIEGNYDVENRDGYTVYRIPEGTREIKQYCFAGSVISEFIIPDSVTKIGNNAFMQSRYKKIILPDSVTEIGDSAFNSSGNYDWDKNKGPEIVLSKNITNIPDQCFSNSQISELEIPENVTKFSNMAFNYCSYLKTLIINSKVPVKLTKSWNQQIEVFNNCRSLEHIYVPNVSLYIQSSEWDNGWADLYSNHILKDRYLFGIGSTISVNFIEAYPIKKAYDTKTQAVIELICPNSFDRCSENPDEQKTVSFKWTIDVEVPVNETGNNITQTVTIDNIPGLNYTITPFDVVVEHGASTLKTDIAFDGTANRITIYEGEDTPLVWIGNWSQYYRQYEIKDNDGTFKDYNYTVQNYSDSYVRMLIMSESGIQAAQAWLQPGENKGGVAAGGEYKYVYFMQSDWDGNVENGIPQNIASLDVTFNAAY